jgi:hypothetical protein
MALITLPQRGALTTLEFPDGCDCKDNIEASWCFQRYDEPTRRAAIAVLLNYILASYTGNGVYTEAELLDKGKCCPTMNQPEIMEVVTLWILWKSALLVSPNVTPPTEGELINEVCKLRLGQNTNAIIMALFCEIAKKLYNGDQQ